MGGTNPYIEQAKYTPATRKFKVTFVREGKTVEVDPERIPYAREGLPGSILDIATGFHLGLDHACGGVCACSTCHVHVLEGLKSCNETSEQEDDELEEAYDLKPISRLGCQCVPNGTMTVKVRIPNWNRNLAREPHGADSMTTKKDE